MKTCIIDSGFANLYSVQNALCFLGENPEIIKYPDELKNYDKVIFPGVGSFGQVSENLHKTGFSQAIRDFCNSGKLLLGICLGMQLLFETSTENSLSLNNNLSSGLGLIKGNVVEIPRNKVPRVPHIGWNKLNIHDKNNKLFENFSGEELENLFVYFVHSFYCLPENKNIITASVNISPEFEAPAIISNINNNNNNNIYGVQFHPERSGKLGLKILNNFMNIK